MMKYSVSALALVLSLVAYSAHADAVDANELLVGIADIDTHVDVDIPLGGTGDNDRRIPMQDWEMGKYPVSCSFLKPSTGIHTPIRSKVMAIKKGRQNLIFVSIDVVGVEKRFVNDIARHLRKKGIKKDEILISGTHTHSGPGTLSKTLPLELVAVDMYVGRNYRKMRRKVLDSINMALAAQEPADLYKSSFFAHGVQRNKFRKIDQDWFNNEAKLLLAKSKASGQWLGGMVNFAVHGGGMPVPLMISSSDFPGQIEINLQQKLANKNKPEAKRPVVLFVNGAEADVGVKYDPVTQGNTVENVEVLGRLFGEQSVAALDDSQLKKIDPEFSVKRERVYLGIPGSSLKKCVGGMFSGWDPKIRVPLIGLFTMHSYLTQVQLGDITMLTWPGEPTTQLGYNLQDAARKLGVQDPWILGLTNDYTAYYTTHDEWFEDHYDSCSSLFMWHGGDRILAKHSKMLRHHAERLASSQ